VSFTPNGAFPDDIARGRADTTRFFLSVQTNSGIPSAGRCNWGDLLVLKPDPNQAQGVDWIQAWADKEPYELHQEMSEDETDSTSTDHHIFTDRNNNVHLICEDYSVGPLGGACGAVAKLGYKNRASARWPDHDTINSLGNSLCSGPSPHMFIQEVSSGPDTLHITWRVGNPSCEFAGYLGHRKTAILNPNDIDWNGSESPQETFVTDRFNTSNFIADPHGAVVVDSEGVYHFFGFDDLTTTGRRLVLHLWGSPPDPGEIWTFTEDQIEVLDDFPKLFSVPLGGLDDASLPIAQSGSPEYIYVAWHRDTDATPDTREIYFTRIPPGGEPADEPIPLTLGDGFNISARPKLDVTPEGYIHLAYHDSTTTSTWDPDHSVDTYHMWTTSDDPMDIDNWSTPTKVTVERRTTTLFPYMYASHDSVWIAYQCHDDDSLQTVDSDCPEGSIGEDCDFEVWAQMGHSLPGEVPDNETDTMTWDGFVYLDRDFVVPSGRTLIISPGTRVFAHAGDKVNQGIDGAKVEIIVKGTGSIVASGDTNQHISMVGEIGTGTGEWYGLRFTEGAPVAGSTTALDFVDFRNAHRAVCVDTLGFNLRDCTFAQSASADIFVDRDYRIPEGKEWKLIGPTTVLVNNSDAANKAWSQDASLAEILVQGALRTFGGNHGAGSDSIYFKSTTTTSQSWTGITVDWTGSGEIYDASIGYATDPIAFQACAYARIWNSRIHDYRDVGIFDGASNAWIRECKVTKGTGTNFTRTGIYLIESTGRVDADSVGYHEASGIKAEFSQNTCNASLAADSLIIGGNTLTGSGLLNGNGLGTGLYIVRGCEHRHPRVTNNVIKKWGGNGLYLQSCAETRVVCNSIVDNWRGVRYDRSSSSAGDSTRFYSNDLRLNRNRNMLVNTAYKLSLRDSASPQGWGINKFRQYNSDTKNIETLDATAIEARYNVWQKVDGTLTQDVSEIRASLTEATQGIISFDPSLSASDSSFDCEGSQALLAIQEAAIPDRSQVVKGGGAEKDDWKLPVSFSLSSETISRSHSSIEIVYHIPADYFGEVRLAVFDVQGRRIRDLLYGKQDPGRYRIEWHKDSDSGLKVGPGVYFVHFRAEGYRRTVKVVLIG